MRDDEVPVDRERVSAKAAVWFEAPLTIGKKDFSLQQRFYPRGAVQ